MQRHTAHAAHSSRNHHATVTQIIITQSPRVGPVVPVWLCDPAAISAARGCSGRREKEQGAMGRTTGRTAHLVHLLHRVQEYESCEVNQVESSHQAADAQFARDAIIHIATGQSGHGAVNRVVGCGGGA